VAIRFNTIDALVEDLRKKHDTKNPFEILRAHDIKLIDEDLGEIYGYYQKLSQIKLIHLHNGLDEAFRNFTCAHELGHAFLHPNENTPRLREQSLNSEIIIEGEANYFGLRLLIDGSHKDYPGIDTAEKILRFYGIPLELERFLKKVLSKL